MPKGSRATRRKKAEEAEAAAAATETLEKTVAVNSPVVARSAGFIRAAIINSIKTGRNGGLWFFLFLWFLTEPDPDAYEYRRTIASALLHEVKAYEEANYDNRENTAFVAWKFLAKIGDLFDWCVSVRDQASDFHHQLTARFQIGFVKALRSIGPVLFFETVETFRVQIERFWAMNEIRCYDVDIERIFALWGRDYRIVRESVKTPARIASPFMNAVYGKSRRINTDAVWKLIDTIQGFSFFRSFCSLSLAREMFACVSHVPARHFSLLFGLLRTDRFLLSVREVHLHLNYNEANSELVRVLNGLMGDFRFSLWVCGTNEETGEVGVFLRTFQQLSISLPLPQELKDPILREFHVLGQEDDLVVVVPKK